MQEQVSHGKEVLLPVIAHYGLGRLWLQKNKKSVEPVKPSSRMLGYVDCLDPASNEKMLLRWLYTMELASLQAKKTLGVLVAYHAFLEMKRYAAFLYDEKNETN